ncbi:pyridoxal-phosphate dependent enzyme [Kribbella qitaiheensis]|uniref:Pyridoxal-phosphate dependent enzyme n=1 Tax=Kribbella qitaiheensis TaxID=1544730 RepID=A0A7G6WSD5_9ACTN|nr:pyridoxal-phosphate dependent enzyme [Kribbella qitaiheensis]QNE16900.1 pyridoxal-phosphate dependent enzyme [Kribbella qitaiheensis]
MRLELARILGARDQIDPVFLNTPQYECEPLGDVLGCRLILKVETLNPVRSFKGRGTETVLSRLEGDADAAVCASAGNLGQALAYSGRRRGIGVAVVASSAANPLKLERMKALGATVILVDGEIEAALETATRYAAETGAFLVEDSRDIGTCEGAATIGVELAESPVELDSVLISLGAGAMASGVGFALKSLRKTTEVICVQPENAPAMTLALRAGHPVEVGAPGTIADGVAGRYVIPEVLDDLSSIADDAVLVSEAAIVEAMRLLHVHAGLVVEPAAALGVASILEGQGRFDGRTVATILCGSNVTPEAFNRWTHVPISAPDTVGSR